MKFPNKAFTLKSFFALFFVLLLSFGLVSCSQPTSNDIERSATNASMINILKTQPIPAISFSRTRETLIEVLKMKSASNATTTVERSAGTGQILRIFPSIGVPIPGDTQLTNPQQKECYGNSSGCVVLEQAEPDGTFSSKSTDSTYVIEVLEDGTKVLYYTENKLSSFFYPVEKVDNFTVRKAGKASATIEVK